MATQSHLENTEFFEKYEVCSIEKQEVCSIVSLKYGKLNMSIHNLLSYLNKRIS